MAPTPTAALSPPPLLLFDGHCNLCSTCVNAFMVLDRRFAADGSSGPRLKLASLQSPVAAQVLQSNGYRPDEFIVPKAPQEESVALISLCPLKVYVRSTAILQATAHLAPWYIAVLCYLAMLIPTVVRDFVYRQVARNRILLFGSTETCRMATKQDKMWFLGADEVSLYSGANTQ